MKIRLFSARKKRLRCLLHGCEAEVKDCARCGWEAAEAKRRAQLSLTYCADGLLRKKVCL